MSKCPICNNELVKNYEHYGPGCVEESSYECPGHYAEVFAYGSTEIHIGAFTAFLHHADPPARRDRVNKIIDYIIKEYKEGTNGSI